MPALPLRVRNRTGAFENEQCWALAPDGDDRSGKQETGGNPGFPPAGTPPAGGRTATMPHHLSRRHEMAKLESITFSVGMALSTLLMFATLAPLA
jgi:hypothetical protein